MYIKMETIALTALFAVAYCNPAWGQASPPEILVDVENIVLYNNNLIDQPKLVPNPFITPAAPPGVSAIFGFAIIIGDVVAVNGKPAKGTLALRSQDLQLTPLNNGRPIADTMRAALQSGTLEILKSDGAAVGIFMLTGMGGARPPGSPLSIVNFNFAILGGTGAFLGARGQAGVAAGTVLGREASMAEDDAYRRINGGGGKRRYVLQVIPMSTPQIVVTGGAPALYHADFSPVTAAQPAKAGELLIAKATGLGPTVPGIDPGQPFPLDATQEVNSPVEVSVNGKPAEVINKIGWPGLMDTYRIDFRVPDGTVAGQAGVQLTAAWIAGSSSNIAIK